VQKFWPILFGVVLLACLGLSVAAPFVPGWWLPHNVCSFGPSVDRLFYLILAFTGFFFLLTLAVLVYGMWRFAARPGAKAVYTHGSHKLEVLWTIVPTAILLFIAFSQVAAWSAIKYQARMPAPDQVFEVTARQFEWRFRYPTTEQNEAVLAEIKQQAEAKQQGKVPNWIDNPHADDIHVLNEVHTWQGAKVRFYLRSRDVLHSFFLPNMRIKQDAVPGKVIPVWFDTDEANIHWDAAQNKWVEDEGKLWELACAELCGWGHYKMRGRVYVHESRADFERWLEQTAKEQRRTETEK
jgi:cytochrome c oxidase subunit 2